MYICYIISLLEDVEVLACSQDGITVTAEGNDFPIVLEYK